jgi:hypothetical protein
MTIPIILLMLSIVNLMMCYSFNRLNKEMRLKDKDLFKIKKEIEDIKKR